MYKIICKNVPGGLLKREAAKSHFRQFGSVKRIVFRTISKVITVEYATEEAVQKAFKYGNVFDNERFSITIESGDTLDKIQLKKVKKETSFNLPDDVKAELDAMGGGPSAALARKIVKRPVLKEMPKKAVKRHVSEDKETTVPKKNKPVTYLKKTEYKELLQIMNMCAITVEDKFKVLDARDKILRMIQKDNGANNGVTRGTCPDMCPEKERLLRVIQHQVSYFEQNSFREMDPRLAVKQYSRSSADQESPLPHELRPVQVLLKTMDYLVYKIIPLGETQNVNMGDWFHFVWDRTRSIRKDITQQELCCTLSVYSIEQCARFHIHCSARLVAEDPSVFDQKINTENSTKCLQTSKYMYNDSRSKGVECPNEPEFRAYIISLNLNDGNFMWEVQRLPLEIQQSKEVKTAIQIYWALNSDNFIRFFKLVRGTTYLNACILMRYFMQVRNRGIDIISKCYTPRIAKAVYPLEALTESFGFESVQHAVEFVLNCGSQMDDSKTSVKSDRSAFIAQDLNCATSDRSINSVESKRQNFSLATIILGLECSPLFKPVEPHSSFNEEGFLIDSLLPKEDFVEPAVEEVKNVEEMPSEDTEMGEEAAGVERSSFVPVEDMGGSLFSSNKNIFALQEKISSDSADASEKLPTNEENMEEESSEDEEPLNNQESNVKSFRSIFDISESEKDVNFSWGGSMTHRNSKETSNEMPIFPQITPSTSMFNKVLPPSELQKSFFSAPTKKPSSSESEQEEMEEPYSYIPVRLRNSLSTPKEESDGDYFLKEIEKRRLEEMERRNEEQREFQSRLDVQSLMLDIVNRVEEKIKESEYLKALRSQMETRRSEKFFKKWRDFVAKRRKQRWVDGLYSFMSERSLKEGAINFSVSPIRYIRPPRIIDLASISNYQNSKRVDLDKYTKVSAEKYIAFRKKTHTPIKTPVYWKCVISIPDDNREREDYKSVNATLSNYFGWEDDETPLIKQKLCDGTPVRVSFVKEIGEVDGANDANGLIFISEYLDNSLYYRIKNKFEETGIHYNVPIVIIVQNRPGGCYRFESMIKNGIISGYILSVGFRACGLIGLIERALDYLTTNATRPPPVGVDHLENLSFRNLSGSDTWKKASCYGKTNPTYGNCSKDPNVVIALYNDGSKKLKDIVLDPTCYEYARFPSEFRQFEELPKIPSDYKFMPDFSKDQCYKDFVTNLFENVMPVGRFDCWPPQSEAELEKLILNFAKNNFKDNFMEIINISRAAIWKTGKTHMEQIMWTDIMEVIAFEKLKSYRAYVAGKIKKEWQYFDHLLVVYNTDSLHDFFDSDWFYLSNPIVKNAITYSFNCSPLKWTECEDTNCCNIQETVDRAKRSLNVNRNMDPGFDINSFNRQLEDVRESIFVSKRINSKFEGLFR